MSRGRSISFSMQFSWLMFMLMWFVTKLKPGVHIIATIATVAQKELSDDTVRSAISRIAEI